MADAVPTKAAGQKRKRNNRRKKQKKRSKTQRGQLHTPIKQEKVEEEERVEFEYVSEPLLQENDPNYEAFKNVFSCFAAPEELCMSREEREKLLAGEEGSNSDAKGGATTEEEAQKEEESKAVMSKREKKKQKRLSVAVLKQIVLRPEVVEVWDVTSSDPVLLVYLKSYRNTVPVPRHWCQKRKYLQGKRGVEKPPFELPDFIAATGISRIRQALVDQEEQKKLKQKQREKMQPKMGKMDIDYQVLHDAFFKHQTKPKLSTVGDLYYEGKEFEVKLKEKRPGQLSDELKAALGMPENAPPPWLINMQRYGPPPSYPNLKIPGLNAAIPAGAQFGYHPGGWGKPPVDQVCVPTPASLPLTYSHLLLNSLENPFMEMFLVLLQQSSFRIWLNLSTRSIGVNWRMKNSNRKKKRRKKKEAKRKKKQKKLLNLWWPDLLSQLWMMDWRLQQELQHPTTLS